MTQNQTCPLCGRILYEGLEGWLYHTRDDDSPCVINSFTSDELRQATSQIARIKEQAFEEGKKSMIGKPSICEVIELIKNETFVNFKINDAIQKAKQEVFDDVEEISTSYYSGYLKGCRRYFISKFEEIKKKHGVE